MAVSKKTKKDSAVEVEETVQNEVEVSTEPETTFNVEVAEDTIEVNEDEAPKETNPKVKIRMRVDHHCVIAMEHYYLHAGKTYTVPQSVKDILNEAGFLAPL